MPPGNQKSRTLLMNIRASSLLDHVLRVAVFFYVSHLHGPIKQGRSVEIKFKKKKCILMYNQGNMRLHVELFIKYVLNNIYSDNNHGQPQSILNIFLTFFSSLYFITTFCGLFSDWYWYHCFVLLGGMKMSGSAGLFNKKINNLPRREPKGGRSGRWETQKKYGHPNPHRATPATVIKNVIIYYRTL